MSIAKKRDGVMNYNYTVVKIVPFLVKDTNPMVEQTNFIFATTYT